MASGVTVAYNENVIYQMPSNGSFKMNTANAYMEDDIDVVVDVEANLIQKTITKNGTYDSSDDNADGYSEVIVDVEGGIHSGDTAPSASLGSDGDLYVQRMTLPRNVNFVEYLGSSGTQYINTGIYATQDIDAIVAGDRMSGTSNSGAMFGVRTGSWGSMSKALYFGSHGEYNGGISVIKTGTSQSGTSTNVPNVSTRRTKTIKDKNGYYVYLSTIDELPTYSKMYRQAGTWQSDMPLCIFAFYQGTTLNIGSSTRVYRVTILEKDVPIADYLPCLDTNNVPCMWDNIAKEYVYNDGTGTFAYGSTATPSKLSDILYVKQNGAWVYIGEADDMNT